MISSTNFSNPIRSFNISVTPDPSFQESNENIVPGEILFSLYDDINTYSGNQVTVFGIRTLNSIFKKITDENLSNSSSTDYFKNQKIVDALNRKDLDVICQMFRPHSICISNTDLKDMFDEKFNSGFDYVSLKKQPGSGRLGCCVKGEAKFIYFFKNNYNFGDTVYICVSFKEINNRSYLTFEPIIVPYNSISIPQKLLNDKNTFLKFYNSGGIKNLNYRLFRIGRLVEHSEFSSKEFIDYNEELSEPHKLQIINNINQETQVVYYNNNFLSQQLTIQKFSLISINVDMERY